MSTRKRSEFDHVARTKELQQKRSEVVEFYAALDPFNGIQERSSPMHLCERIRLVFREDVSFNPDWELEIVRLVKLTGIRHRGTSTSYADGGDDGDQWADGRSPVRIDLDFFIGAGPHEIGTETAEYKRESEKLCRLYELLHDGGAAA